MTDRKTARKVLDLLLRPIRKQATSILPKPRILQRAPVRLAMIFSWKHLSPFEMSEQPSTTAPAEQNWDLC